ncbi:hypothetical protein M4578_24310 [Salipiger sp. P9]|uniref:hypothetical protein n=1 Tax=Salipiger pentaromativorans TaxID=2943193 RepID=UPI0021582891|nr:hypothetical protein [Salipiger pentaromativorans]MCR8550957.1 hypothetical protein [Salipiger pentaromativorans]
MSNRRNGMLLLALAVLAFWLGMLWQRHLYEDRCLDLGGGREPGGYPVCVVVKEPAS